MEPKIPATEHRGSNAQGWGGVRGMTQMNTWGWDVQVEWEDGLLG